MAPSSEHETEVALALCNLGFDCKRQASNEGDGFSSPRRPSSLADLADAACSSMSYSTTSRLVSPPAGDRLYAHPSQLPTPLPPQIHSSARVKASLPKPTAAHSVPVHKASHLDISARRAKKNDVKHRRRNKNEDTSVTFEEMTRLMNTYGPIKCFRNRSTKNCNKEVKPASILRKFYRWMPDFEERFVKQPDGRYMPKIGHENEIKYREMMRGRDEKCVITKRNMRRYSLDVIGDPMDGNFGMHKSH